MREGFASRSLQKELLDRSDIPFEDIALNMQELDMINTRLGGHKITISGFKQVAGSNETLSVMEIGCGGGDNLQAIANYCTRNRISVKLTGVDLNRECIEFARSKNSNICWIAKDYRDVEMESIKPDVIFSSLFCHHFTDGELVEMMKWMHKNCRLGFFINDLHRNAIAYYSIRFLTRLFSKSYLVKNDAPLSVKRGFKKEEWINILERAGIANYEIQWRWAFRYLIISLK